MFYFHKKGDVSPFTKDSVKLQQNFKNYFLILKSNVIISNINLSLNILS